MLQHHFIKFYPHKSLNFNVFRLHITNCYGHHFTIGRIVHTLLKILSFATSHYAIGMQLIVVYNYKFSIV
jgi:hypothetical protein